VNGRADYWQPDPDVMKVFREEERRGSDEPSKDDPEPRYSDGVKHPVRTRRVDPALLRKGVVAA